MRPRALGCQSRRASRSTSHSPAAPTLVKRAMAYDSRWTANAQAYDDLYRGVLRVDHALGVGRADHFAGLLLQQDTQRRAIRETGRAEINVFGDERIDE